MWAYHLSDNSINRSILLQNMRLLVLTEYYDRKSFLVNLNNLEISIQPKQIYDRVKFSTFYYNNQVYILGGMKNDRIPMVECEKYDCLQ